MDVPIYFREATERMVYILNHSGATVVFVAGGEQAEKLMACRDQLRTVQHIIVADAEDGLRSDALRYETLIATAGDADVAAYRMRVGDRVDRNTGDNYLYVGNDGRAEGRDADAREFVVEFDRFDASRRTTARTMWSWHFFRWRTFTNARWLIHLCFAE